jgi:hypothetical protein
MPSENPLWPDQTDLRTKLFGNLEDLRRTAAFVRATKKKNHNHVIIISIIIVINDISASLIIITSMLSMLVPAL